MRKSINCVRMITAAIVLAVIAGFFGFVPAYANNATYYVDNANGNDNNNGTSTSTAWKTLSKVNSKTFAPGDRILLKKGGSWTGQLYPKGSGTSGSPIVIDSYGTGNRPIINGSGIAGGAVYLYNQKFWEIKNLEVTNKGSVNGAWRQGILIKGENAGTLNYLRINGCYVHNVNGYTDNNNGWDQWNTSGGIIFMITGSVSQTTFNDIIIDGNTVSYNDSKGIVTNSLGWGGFTNLTVSNNTVDHNAGDGIMIADATSPLIQYNVAIHNHNGCPDNSCVGIWFIRSANAVCQYNEAYETQTLSDGMGFDIDWDTSNGAMQYNYSHDNVGGFMLVCCDGTEGRTNTNGVVRYNISQNDGNYMVITLSGPVNGTRIYNNTIYVGAGRTPQVIGGGDWGGLPQNTVISNNIFYLAGKATWDFSSMNNTTFNNNLYYGYHDASEPSTTYDPYKLTSDPRLVNPGSAGTGRTSTDGYKLGTGSPAINSGILIGSNGGKDYWGNPVSSTAAPNRGAYNGSASGGSTVYFSIINRNSGKALSMDGSTTDGGAAVQEVLNSGYRDQQWQKVDLGNGYFQLINHNSGKALSMDGSTADGAGAVQEPVNTSYWDQQWQIAGIGDEYYKIVNHNSGKVLAISSGSTSDGANAIQWPWGGYNDQQWQLIQVP